MLRILLDEARDPVVVIDLDASARAGLLGPVERDRSDRGALPA
jgi:hypothetical protein